MTSNKEVLSKLKLQVAFDDAAAAKPERKQRKKPKLAKSSKPEVYHHTPTFAAQSFALTTTPEVYKKKETHKLSRPVLDHAKTKHTGQPLRSHAVVHIIEDESSSDCDRSSSNTLAGEAARRSPKATTRRFTLIHNPHYELFSNAVLNQPSQTGSGRTQTMGTMEAFTRGRPDWSEMDEEVPTEKGLRRMASVASTKSSAKSQKSRRHSMDLSSLLKGNTIIRVPNDGDSVYKSRGCVPWRHRA